MNKLWIPLFLALALSACAAYGTAKGVALDKGAKFYDETLQNALVVKCKAASVGSIERRYMQTQETWELWYKECLGSGARTIPETPALETPE